MSHNHYADVMPFVIHGAYELSHYSTLGDVATDEERALISPGGYAEGDYLESEEEYEKREADEDFINHLEFRGWKHDPNDQTSLGKHAVIIGDAWRKGDHTVWLINESEYSNVGDYFISVVANDRESIEAFKKDFEIKQNIVEMEAVTSSY